MDEKEKQILRIKLICIDIETVKEYKKIVNEVIQDKVGKQMVA